MKLIWVKREFSSRYFLPAVPVVRIEFRWNHDGASIRVYRGPEDKVWDCHVSWRKNASVYVHAVFEDRRSARSASLAGLNFLKQVGFKPEGE